MLINKFKKKLHKCDFNKIIERSNVIQYDDMGYPLRLCICQCKCGMTDQQWIDTKEQPNDVELIWTKKEN